MTLTLILISFSTGSFLGIAATAFFFRGRLEELTLKANLARSAFQEQVVRHGYVDGVPRVVTMRLVPPVFPEDSGMGDGGVKN